MSWLSPSPSSLETQTTLPAKSSRPADRSNSCSCCSARFSPSRRSATLGHFGTLAHELTHWTGTTKWVDRLVWFGDRKAYAFARCRAACYRRDCMVVRRRREDSAARVRGLEVVGDDKRNKCGSVCRCSGVSAAKSNGAEDGSNKK